MYVPQQMNVQSQVGHSLQKVGQHWHRDWESWNNNITQMRFERSKRQVLVLNN